MKIILTLVLAALAGTALAQGTPDIAAAAGIPANTPTTLQMRYDQVIGKLQQQISQLQGEVRDLQRRNESLAKKVDDANGKSAGVSDRVQELQNVSLVNIQAAEKQLSQQQREILGKLWGEQKRDCPDLSAKHQQIKVLQRPDGERSVRFLCYDGKAIHLGTEVHDPAE